MNSTTQTTHRVCELIWNVPSIHGPLATDLTASQIQSPS
jgi:hypothetical protein